MVDELGGVGPDENMAELVDSHHVFAVFDVANEHNCGFVAVEELPVNLFLALDRLELLLDLLMWILQLWIKVFNLRWLHDMIKYILVL